MKRLLSALLVLALVFSLAACGIQQAIQPTTEPTQSQTTDPTTVSDPTDPTDPEDPAIPSDPADPSTPAEPDTPTLPTPSIPSEPEQEPEPEPEPLLDPDGSYYSKEDVALYIHLYGKLPSNFITKSQAKALGWRSGSLEQYAPGKVIGGDTFQNREGLLPKKSGRTFTECDIDTLGQSSRGTKRIVFSNDGLVYYTDDHYRSFTLLYGEP